MPKEEKKSLAGVLKKEISGLLWLAAGLFVLLCLVSYNSGDPSFNNNLNPDKVHNFGGVVGAHVADLLYQAVGLPALLIPLICFLVAWRLLKMREVKFRFYKTLAFLGLLLSLGGMLALGWDQVSLFGQTINEAGGGAGRILVDTLSLWLNLTGAAIVLAVFFLVSLILSTRFSMVLFLSGRLDSLGRGLEERRERRAAQRAQKAREKGERPERGPLIQAPAPRPAPAAARLSPKKKKQEEQERQAAFEFLEPSGTYHRPPLSLLDHEGGAAPPVDRESLMANARLLENKLKDFGVEGEVVEVKPGPVVTMYEFAPAPGVKVNKIAGLSDDLSMALRALSIRIVAPIPGRGVVGIEIPNRERATVWLKDIIEADAFQRAGGKLPMALGQDIFGGTVVADLAKMPHLLVAGSTGSGKSVSINTMILSLLYRATPEDVRIIMVDPKMLELSIYEGIPHLLLPVVTNPKKAALALNWAVREMERRYRLMADKGVRNIDGYNKKLAREEKDKAEQKAQGVMVVEAVDPMEDELPEVEAIAGEELEHGHLPYIVVIVDELADLMMVAGREIEESIARLAQMARAAGIHLILATQRPSVDVITGLIKANFPTRISFKVFSRTDSRTILDSMGAETLLGMGDMLYLPPGTGALQRVHGAFVSELEVQRVVDFLKKQGEPEYDKSILEAPPSAEGAGEGEDDEMDEKWDEALALVAETRQASISMLQRRLRVGYNRAARMIEKMEQDGIIGPSDGTSRPREVFINRMEP
ncbi:DNA translocase FtsK [Geoalkalibacter halelectricus]|uniref:DNA translocase FtsK 4TM domain-containing protein n=1 Tax=Geoalkalibacter halelectricus TaxID=2847045 RepID=A0ABY5ZT15_9BACT|nr:DNA translocase FtsK [Geoalkalibacter halelectricus]MDO3377430.1 DNA translocase FtsK 4TM domain-containing protein [Geoalkalibacter halelectricus]UWZ80809.1 DNA translocase FtsK 4TM domain-containing protein [Geoalkalibacter halelectricus]